MKKFFIIFSLGLMSVNSFAGLSVYVNSHLSDLVNLAKNKSLTSQHKQQRISLYLKSMNLKLETYCPETTTIQVCQNARLQLSLLARDNKEKNMKSFLKRLEIIKTSIN